MESKKRKRDENDDITPSPEIDIKTKKPKIEKETQKSLKDYAPRNTWKYIGSGISGQVYLTTELATDEQVAIKVFKLAYNRHVQFDMKQSIDILKQLRPICKEYILCFKDYFIDENEEFLVTEYLENYVTLNDALNGTKTELKDKTKLVCNVYRAFLTLYEQGIHHGDIYGANILVDPSTLNVKLIDFDAAYKDQQYWEGDKNKIAWIIVRILNAKDGQEEGQLGNYNYFRAVKDALYHYKDITDSFIFPKDTPESIASLVKALMINSKSTRHFPELLC
jgi:serine/threonine protein kinase